MMVKKLGFVINLDRCLGCQSCELACKQENRVKAGIRWRRVAPILEEHEGRPFAYFLSIACNHCEKPACLENCPTGAYQKTPEGIVIHDRDRCIGCRLCTMACPYGSPQYNDQEGRVEKCDFCIDRIRAGLKPACVQTCPTEVLTVEEIETSAAPDWVKEIKGFPDPSITNPSVRFKPPRVPETEVDNWDMAKKDEEEKP